MFSENGPYEFDFIVANIRTAYHRGHALQIALGANHNTSPVILTLHAQTRTAASGHNYEDKEKNTLLYIVRGTELYHQVKPVFSQWKKPVLQRAFSPVPQPASRTAPTNPPCDAKRATAGCG